MSDPTSPAAAPSDGPIAEAAEPGFAPDSSALLSSSPTPAQPDASASEAPASSPSSEPESPGAARSRPRRSRETIQIRALVDRTGIPYKRIVELFKSAGIYHKRMRYMSKVNIEQALAALSLVDLPPSAPIQRAEETAIRQEEADLAEALRKGSFLPPSVKATGSGKLSDDPVPQAVLDGDHVEQMDAFPYPRPDRCPPDLFISSLNISNSQVAEARRQAKLSLGWRFIDSGCEKLLNQLYPDARWRRMVNAFGLITSGDLALACFPRAAWEKRKARQRDASVTARVAVKQETFAANIEDSARSLRDQKHVSGTHIAPIIEDAETADDRANFEHAKTTGRDPRRARVGLGRASTSR